MGVIEVVNALLKEYMLCDNCLGRQFALLGHGLTNEKRGTALKLACVIDGSRLESEKSRTSREILLSLATNGLSNVAAETLEALGCKVEKREEICYLCGGVFKHIYELAEQAAEKLTEYEYVSFLVGIKAEAEVEDREDELRSRFGIKWGESIRNEFSREIGKMVMEITKKTVDPRRPDILVLINPFKKSIDLEVNSLFIAGRYLKLVRGISQSKWICTECGGKGCERCNWTGKMYADSVEELIVGPLLEVTEGKEGKLHASGREDVDVRTLGSGRPFVVEVKRPKLRKIDLVGLRRLINERADGKIEVGTLKFSSKEVVRILKDGEKTVKVYRAVVEFAGKLDDENITKITELSNSIINQLTPLRVAHRRAMKTRKKYLYGIEIKRLKPNLIEMLMRCQGGLYVKELINGDEGRTRPSVSEVTGISAKCVELDVMKVELEGY